MLCETFGLLLLSSNLQELSLQQRLHPPIGLVSDSQLKTLITITRETPKQNKNLNSASSLDE